jgi:hypothetical protein
MCSFIVVHILSLQCRFYLLDMVMFRPGAWKHWGESYYIWLYLGVELYVNIFLLGVKNF